MSQQMAWNAPAGQMHKEVTSVTLVNNTTKKIDNTVPAGKMWILRSIKAINCDDVTRTINARVFKEAAKTNLLTWLETDDIGAANIFHVPSGVTTSRLTTTGRDLPKPLEAGNTIEIEWVTGGASTGATDADGLVIEYEEVALSA